MMMRRTRKGFGLTVVFLALLAGCGGGRLSVADYEVVVAVKRYNQALPVAYAKGNAGHLAGTATPDEMQRVDDLIAFLAQGHYVMDARQETFQAGPVLHDGPDKASLEATEIWWYRHWSPSTGEIKQAPRRVRYKNRYYCMKSEGRWLVDRLEELGFERLQTDGTGK